jgi:tetratricopeptide (TPR) repeat protein
MAVIADAATSDGVNATLELLFDLDARGTPPALPGMQDVPQLADALLAVSQMYALIGDEDGSELLLRESIRLNPDDAMALNNLGYMRIEAGHADAETIANIERAGEMTPDNISILDTVAWLRYKQGRFDAEAADGGALDRLKRVLVLLGVEPAPEVLAEVLDHQGDTLWRLGRADEAVAAWARVVEILQDEEWRRQMIQSYAVLQSQVWGLLVSDPQAMYHRDFGVMLERVRQKLAVAEQGGDPPVAPTFQEFSLSD